MLKHSERISRAEDEYNKADVALARARSRHEKAAAELRRLKLSVYAKENDVLTTLEGARGTVLARCAREDDEPEFNVFFGQGAEAYIAKVRGHVIAELERNGEKV